MRTPSGKEEGGGGRVERVPPQFSRRARARIVALDSEPPINKYETHRLNSSPGCWSCPTRINQRGTALRDSSRATPNPPRLCAPLPPPLADHSIHRFRIPRDVARSAHELARGEGPLGFRFRPPKNRVSNKTWHFDSLSLSLFLFLFAVSLFSLLNNWNFFFFGESYGNWKRNFKNFDYIEASKIYQLVLIVEMIKW